MKQLEVGDVFAALQPGHNVVDGRHVHGALPHEVVSERLPRARPERARRHTDGHSLPHRFAADKTRGKLHER